MCLTFFVIPSLTVLFVLCDFPLNMNTCLGIFINYISINHLTHFPLVQLLKSHIFVSVVYSFSSYQLSYLPSRGLTVSQCQWAGQKNKATEVKADKTDIDWRPQVACWLQRQRDSRGWYSQRVDVMNVMSFFFKGECLVTWQVKLNMYHSEAVQAF